MSAEKTAQPAAGLYPESFLRCGPGKRSGWAAPANAWSGLDPRYLENGEYITWQQGFNFSYDATLPKPELFPSVLAGKEKHLVPRPIKKLSVEPLTAGRIIAQGIFLENDPTLPKAQRMQTAYLSASRRMDLGAGEGPVFSWAVPEGRRADGVYLVADLGGECAGLLALSLDVPERTEVLIGIGEHLDDLRVRSFCRGTEFLLPVYRPMRGTMNFSILSSRWGCGTSSYISAA